MNNLIRTLKNYYLPFLFGIPLFFCVYHYNGVVFDGILYVTQYLYSVNPTRFLGDPAFEFGNQNSLGLFSPFFGLFVRIFGVARGAFVYTFFMQLAWVVAAIFFVRSLLRLIWQKLWILPTVILMAFFFANGMVLSHIGWFQYIPMYVCSRSFSMVLGIAAMALLFNQKKYLSFVLILLGTVIHPITAGWCLPFWMFFFYPKTRIPICVISFVFPFTFLLHWHVLDFLPEDWLSRPLPYAPNYEVISRYVLLLVFWGILRRKTLNNVVQRISLNLFCVTAIACYWDVWGGYGEHIFLHQVQPWRAVWLPTIVAVPLGVCCVKDIARRFLGHRQITTHDFSLLLLIVSFISPVNIISVSVVALIFFVVKKKCLTQTGVVAIFAAFMLGTFVVQQYYTWCLQGLLPFLNSNFVTVGRIRDSFLVYQLVFVVGFALFFLRQRRYVLSAILLLSVFFSRFLLLPALPLFLYLFPNLQKTKYWGIAAFIVVLTMFDGLIDVETRRTTMIDGLPVNFYWICLASVLSFASVCLSKRFSYVPVAIWIFACSLVAVVSYSAESADWKTKEAQLDYYFHHPIFPQVAERGKMLFYVSGRYVSEPRLQFFTGSYISNSSMVGSVFSKEHYRTALVRSHMLYQKDRNPQSHQYFDYSVIINKIADADTLIERVSFLCENEEISHLVTDKADLPYVKVDSTIVQESQKVYLYGCPSGK